jgi:hypothetical protein
MRKDDRTGLTNGLPAISKRRGDTTSPEVLGGV